MEKSATKRFDLKTSRSASLMIDDSVNKYRIELERRVEFI